MAGGVLQLAVQWPALSAIGMTPRIALGARGIAAAWRHGGTRQVLARMAPALLGVSVAQISLVINTQIASHVAVGAVSWLSYADRLMEFPTALLGVALGVVLLPQLAAAQAADDDARYRGLLDWGLRLALLLALPCALALLVFPVGLVSVLFHYGRFGDADVAATAWALRGYGAGLLGLIGVKLLAPAYFARADVGTPVRIAIGVLFATQAMNLVFVPWMGHAGLALAIGLGALVNAGCLLVGLLRRGWYRFAAGWGVFLLRIAPANLALAAALLWAAGALDWVGMRAEPWARAGWLTLVLAGVAILYFALLGVAGLRPAHFARRG
jgi:putative peptidoglycan lipid II flippase